MRSYRVLDLGHQHLRMPFDAEEARDVSERFRNRRSGESAYLYADVILDSGEYLRFMEFDDSGIATRCVYMTEDETIQPELFGKRVIRSCPIHSFSNGEIREWATVAERMLFAKTEGKRITISGIPMPPPLVSLMESGKWIHPGHDTMKEAIPFLDEQVDLMTGRIV